MIVSEPSKGVVVTLVMISGGSRIAGSIAVGIPACNEAAYIERWLDALGRQIGRPVDDIVVLVNNTTDATAALARSVKMHTATRVHVMECVLPPDQAHAGWARRLAMEAAANVIIGEGVVLTTDADGVVDPDWLHFNLMALEAGADAVAGWVDLDPADWAQIPLTLHEDDARETEYDALCDEIHAWLDPDPHDPLPRHTQHSGASIGVTIAAYRAAGGVPPVAHGEDRALLRALRRIDARIRHSPDCHVTVSGRMEGRARGGMADTIRRRMVSRDATIDDRLEPADGCVRRAMTRHRLRVCLAVPELVESLARDLELNAGQLADDLVRLPFGQVWDAIESVHPMLRARRVALHELAAETRRAGLICSRLRARGRLIAPTVERCVVDVVGVGR